MKWSKEIIAIITLAVAVLVGVCLLIYKVASIGDTEENERQISEYQKEIKILETAIEANMKTINQNDETIEHLQVQIVKAEQNVTTLNSTLNEVKKLYEEKHLHYKFHLLLGEVLGTLSLAGNIYALVDGVVKEMGITQQLDAIGRIKGAIDMLTDKINEAHMAFLDDFLFLQEIHYDIKKDLLFDAQRDGFRASEFRNRVCGQNSIIIIITSTWDFKFGLIFPGIYECDDKRVENKHATTFSVNNFGYASVNAGSPAICNEKHYLVCIGEHDITINEKGEGKIDPDKAYEIPSPYIADRFYHPTLSFTAQNVQVYNYSVSVNGNEYYQSLYFHDCIGYLKYGRDDQCESIYKFIIYLLTACSPYYQNQQWKILKATKSKEVPQICSFERHIQGGSTCPPIAGHSLRSTPNNSALYVRHTQPLLPLQGHSSQLLTYCTNSQKASQLPAQIVGMVARTAQIVRQVICSKLLA
eukprot:TRINITY_DN2561_c1_g2_i1.p1 TRINITY_DN2561_c1_g2~~TRINITY_DN2561_c1_g2_i1.p1  ORF type:complete len:496 (+),score=2.38 TRINITY_DN2561_c1_g2_i1:78-1490(+)